MTEQYNSLNEKTKLIELALKYTGGDMDKAKSMVSGQYQDIIVLKCKFTVPSLEQAGLFLAFFNTMEEYIANITTVISSNVEIYDKVRIFDNWKNLFSDIIAYRQHGQTLNSDNFSNFLMDSFISYDVFPDVQGGNLDDLTKTVFDILTKSFNAVDVQCQLELGITSSIAIDLTGVEIEIPGGISGKEDKKDNEILSPADEKIKSIESEAKYIISGEIIVSPVKGRYINDIAVGEKIRVMLNTRDAVSHKILTVLNAIDSDGKISPIKGRIKAKIPLEKGGYIIYALVAKGVLAKIVEEENVKIQMDVPEEEVAEKETDDSKIIYLMLAIVFLIIVAGIVLFNLL
ncbi:MAG TPA: hypothetical protein PK926_01455 [Spirochaetota bacterium]|nr:hypothetical protein [Spirochaetota bacterium]HPI88076.1 hypothetical protein [Spirochaetota bacterium]HPR46439.1 hypothetical protein [Spirochaetota bacterium]